MKTEALKKIIKEAVREAIQEEIKDILLEAVRTPKQAIVENIQPQKVASNSPVMDPKEKREAYQNILGDMQSNFTTQNVAKPFNPQGGLPGGDLPEGELNMNQIMSLMNK
tara:strand:+ start:1851 stop:2180 length:330 start_codon:yes stop_codon:yes gene_type:complete